MRDRALMTIGALLLAGSLALSGCSAGPAGPKKPSNRQMASAVQKASGFSVTLRSEPAVGPTGGTFSLTLTVRNLSGKPASFTLPSGQTYEFAAFTRGGDEVWRWSKGMMFTQALAPVTFAPGDSQVYKVAWNTGTTPSGLYSIQGYFLGLPDIKPTVSVEITGP
jgi:hypothetical protein